MMSLQEWKNLAMMSFIILTTMLIAAYIIAGIVERIKNKAQKRTRKQIIRQNVKTDLCKYLTRNMKQDFIGERKMIFYQLVRM